MRVAEGTSPIRSSGLPDEISVLTDTFNDMAGQLQDTIRQVENGATSSTPSFST